MVGAAALARIAPGMLVGIDPLTATVMLAGCAKEAPVLSVSPLVSA
jgi:uncharacterized lipoprotein YajG